MINSYEVCNEVYNVESENEIIYNRKRKEKSSFLSLFSFLLFFFSNIVSVIKMGVFVWIFAIILYPTSSTNYLSGFKSLFVTGYYETCRFFTRRTKLMICNRIQFFLLFCLLKTVFSVNILDQRKSYVFTYVLCGDKLLAFLFVYYNSQCIRFVSLKEYNFSILKCKKIREKIL